MKQDKKTTHTQIPICPRLTELARAYNLSDKNMRLWLAEHKTAIGKRVGQRYSPRQVEIIREKLGRPRGIFTKKSNEK